MGRNGFTLLELLIVMAIGGILLTIAGVNWNNMQKKSAVETETKMIYADLMATRLDALYSKRARSVVLSSTQFSVYSSSLTSVNPQSRKTLRYPLKWKPASTTLTLSFDSGGLYTAGADLPLCVDPANNLTVSNLGAVDSLVVSAARIKIGKRSGDCDVSNIAEK